MPDAECEMPKVERAFGLFGRESPEGKSLLGISPKQLSGPLYFWERFSCRKFEEQIRIS